MCVLAKRILSSPPQETCGIWPWDEVDPEDYPTFIVGEDRNGSQVRACCNPDLLANYFGTNPDAPHYLTQVHFSPEVLQRYYDDPGLYSVRDGHLRRAGKWGLDIDNDNPDVVIAFLGDIGRYIPASHWDHWRAHNIAPTQKMSEAALRRSFFGQVVGSSNPQHRFKATYVEPNRVWEESWGWPLFRNPKGQDADAIRQLRIPLNDTGVEMRAQLLNLALVLVDLLNEGEIARELPKVPNEKGISKLERFLKKHAYEHVDRDISMLRKIQELRSRVAAHVSGKRGQELLEKEFSHHSPQEYFGDLLTSATQTMNDLIAFAERPTPE